MTYRAHDRAVSNPGEMPLSSNPRSKPLRLALIGLGPQGAEHLEAVGSASDVQFVAGVELQADLREKVARQYPALRGHLYAAIDELQTESLDALVLALPHHAYAEVWDKIIGLGLPLLKEKPLARNLEEARYFLNTARQAGCQLQTAIQRRNHPSYKYLRNVLRESGETIREVHAHLHLGFGLPPTAQAGAADVRTWRNDPKQSGGGCLLDSGYHMVDLLHYLLGPFELVASTLLNGGRLMDTQALEDRVILSGRTAQVWVMLDSWLHGASEPGSPTGFKKSEGLLVQTDRQQWRADRAGVWRAGQVEAIYTTRKDWQAAMASQLDDFAQNIRTNTWNDATLWDQLPAMRVIDQAYQQGFHF